MQLRQHLREVAGSGENSARSMPAARGRLALGGFRHDSGTSRGRPALSDLAHVDDEDARIRAGTASGSSVLSGTVLSGTFQRRRVPVAAPSAVNCRRARVRHGVDRLARRALRVGAAHDNHPCVRPRWNALHRSRIARGWHDELIDDAFRAHHRVAGRGERTERLVTHRHRQNG